MKVVRHYMVDVLMIKFSVLRILAFSSIEADLL